MQEQVVIEGWRGMMVHMGLGSPTSRALSVAITVGGASYAMGYPRKAFRRDGSMRPFAPLSAESDATVSDHFLLIPVVAGTAAFLFT